MQIIDILLLVVLLSALVVGLQRGFFASLGSLLGVIAGGAAALWVVPLVNDAVPWDQWRGILVLAVAVLLLVFGAAVGGALGMLVRRGADRIRLRAVERLAGGAVSVVVAALAISLVGQSVSATGMPVVSQALASSQVLRTIEDLTPRPVQTTLAQLRGAVMDGGLPRVGELLVPGSVDAAPEVQLDDPALATAAQSVARVSGVAYACGTSATGSGFVLAPDRVVTNAHVVAGVETPVVEVPGETAKEGRIVYFDPIDDLAVIAVDGLAAPALAVVPTLVAGDAAVVQGYPFGGPFTMGGAEVLSVGGAPVPDIYEDQVASREVYALAATVQPGNSGGPLLTAEGDVAGVVFARGEGDADRGYAMTTTELGPVLAQAEDLTQAVSTGRCLG
ncbi:MarP family serine protease [Microbacterium sp. LRZ72]|uniref:MarP family serine protease n=1 Tax=Microbacterium sp. LRZ72 TaxID=2942481 RepID=UPI0029B1896E|nr:MarP family serine protease [Microbacterium sp. LRZ72]MDX2375770.1 MarP family serine protease [Microbacterium sp. LRZ72]